jgi:hypothetical protein
MSSCQDVRGGTVGPACGLSGREGSLRRGAAC